MPADVADALVEARHLEDAGALGPALCAYEAVLARPDLPDAAAVEALSGLARTAQRLDMPEAALDLWRQVRRRDPSGLEAVNGAALALAALGRQGDALEVLRSAILAAPHEARLWTSLGVLVNEGGDSAAALALLDEAVRLAPDFAAALHNRGDVRFDLGRLMEAEADFDAAALHASSAAETATIALARALLHLHRGELERGWSAYAARLHPDHPSAPVLEGPGVRWTPEGPLAERRLLLLGEQGVGDEAMMLGLVPDVLAALGPGGRLTLALDPRLLTLAERSFPGVETVAHRTSRRDGRARRSADGDADLWAPLGDLLGRFRPDLASFPRRAYLRPDPARVAHWRGWLEGAAEGRPVAGLSWRSGLNAGRRARHAPAVADFAPLLQTPGVRFLQLQYGAREDELATLDALAAAPLLRPPGIDLKDDLDDLAALASALDRLVSVPNATAAIAAASGAETWFLTAPAAWPRLGTDGYPWYARARSFPAERFGDWGPVVASVARALTSAASG